MLPPPTGGTAVPQDFAGLQLTAVKSKLLLCGQFVPPGAGAVGVGVAGRARGGKQRVHDEGHILAKQDDRKFGFALGSLG